MCSTLLIYERFARFLKDFLSGSLVYRTTLCRRPWLPDIDIRPCCCSRDQGSSSTRLLTLILLHQLRYAIVNCGLFVVEIVFLCIDDDHRMPNSPCKFFCASTLDGHVRDEIGHITHLLTFNATTRLLTWRIDILLLGCIPLTTTHGGHAVIRRISRL